MICKPKAGEQSRGWFLPAMAAAVAVACSSYVARSLAAEVEIYLRGAAQRDVAMFDAIDRGRDGRVTIEQVRGNVDLEARFNDFDINRDGVITREELTRYIRLRYGVASGTE